MATADVKVTAKCVGCGHREEVRREDGPRPDDAVPMCPKCFSPMVAERAGAAVRGDH